MNDARLFIEQIGPNAAVSGTDDRQSGRAILAQQQAGMSMLAMVYAGHNDFVMRVFKMIWQRVRQYWQTPRWIRVTDDLDAVKFIYVNEFLGFRPKVDVMTGEPVMDENGQPAREPVVRLKLADMEVDLRIERVPHVNNAADEQMLRLGELLQNPEFRKPEILAAWVENSQLRDKKKIIDALNYVDPEQAELQRAADMAELEEKKAVTQTKLSKVKMDEAQTNRMIEETKQLMMNNLMQEIHLNQVIGSINQAAPQPSDDLAQNAQMVGAMQQAAMEEQAEREQMAQLQQQNLQMEQMQIQKARAAQMYGRPAQPMPPTITSEPFAVNVEDE